MKHCQLTVIYCLVFSYPTLCLQPAKPDKLSCLGHLDENHSNDSTSPTTTSLLSYQRGGKSFQSTTTTTSVFMPKTTPVLLPLCYSSALSLAQDTCSTCHVSPAPAQVSHMLSSAPGHWGSCCCAQTLKEKVPKQAEELSSSEGM